ncbi:protein FAM161A-like [Engraulis encrasicolus]|uniref:protein FAM161A-like n=1 Tax=Engraulis encrasicolus TaxID=184585 RepID=UPI002FD27EAA
MKEMWLPHRNAVIRHSCLRTPIRDYEGPRPASDDLYYLSLKAHCSVREPQYNQLRYTESIDRHDRTQETKSDAAISNLELVVQGRECASPEEVEERHGGDVKDTYPDSDPGPTAYGPPPSSDGGSSMAWMWDRFNVDDYCPRQDPEPEVFKPKAVEAKPRVTKVQPFQMTLREEERRRRKPSQAWEEVKVELVKPPQFKANPVPPRSRIAIYHKMVEECERQRKILHDRRMKFLQDMQCPFTRQDRHRQRHHTAKANTTSSSATRSAGGSVTQNAMAHEEEMPTFQPAINHKVPDFPQLQRSFEVKLRQVRQKKQPTIPQPFSFEANVSGQKISGAKELPRSVRCHGDTKATTAAAPASKAVAPPRSPRNTKATMLRDQVVRKRLACVAVRGAEEERQRDTRAMLQKEIGMWVAAHNWISSANKEKAQYYRRAMRARSAEYQAQLTEILDRVNHRPLMLNTLFNPCTSGDHSVLMQEPFVIDEKFTLEPWPTCDHSNTLN